jgi:hypothetical protein
MASSDPPKYAPSGISYDSGKRILVDPDELYQIATVGVKGVVDDMVNNIDAIMATIENLAVSWTGGSAQEARDFGDRWQTAMTNLLGTKDDPGQGALNKVMTGVAIAGSNYGEGEDTVFKMFRDLADGVAGASSDTSGQSATTNLTQPPITETPDSLTGFLPQILSHVGPHGNG